MFYTIIDICECKQENFYVTSINEANVQEHFLQQNPGLLVTLKKVIEVQGGSPGTLLPQSPRSAYPDYPCASAIITHKYGRDESSILCHSL